MLRCVCAALDSHLGKASAQDRTPTSATEHTRTADRPTGQRWKLRLLRPHPRSSQGFFQPRPYRRRRRRRTLGGRLPSRRGAPGPAQRLLGGRRERPLGSSKHAALRLAQSAVGQLHRLVPLRRLRGSPVPGVSVRNSSGTAPVL